MGETTTIVVALTGMAAVMLGVFQFVKSYITSSDARYQDLVKKWETEHYERAAAEHKAAIWKMRAYYLKNVNTELKSRLALVNKTIETEKKTVKTTIIDDD